MKKVKVQIEKLFPIVWICIAFLYDIYIQIKYYRQLLDCDMASEMVLADFLNKKHAIISDEWYYSTEIRFFNMQWFYRIGLLISQNNWLVARIIGMALGLLVMLFTWLMVAKNGKLGNIGLWAGAIILLPGGYYYAWLTIYGGYYIPYIIFSFLSLALILTLLSENIGKKKKYLCYCFLCVTAMASGLNGIKQLMYFFAPAFLAAVFMIWPHKMDKRAFTIKEYLKEHPVKIRLFKASAIALFFNLLGYAVNIKILRRFFSFMSYTDNSFNYKGIKEAVEAFIHSYGYSDGYSLFSVRGIESACGLLVGFLVVFSAIRLIVKWKKLSFTEQYIVCLSFACILVSIFVFAYLNGEGKYYQGILPFGLIIVIIEIKSEEFVLQFTKFVSLNILTIALLFASMGSMNEQTANPVLAKQGLYEISQWLEQQGYDQGISSLWYASAIEEYTNGDIVMRSYEIDKPYCWLQAKERVDSTPSGKTFILSGTCKEDIASYYPSLAELIEKGNGVLVYESDSYTVYEVNGDDLW